MPTLEAGIDTRASNARDCLLALRRSSAPQTVGEVATSTGLSRPTVDAVLRDLQAAGAARAAAASETAGRGRPARRFEFNRDAATVTGIDIGARTVRCTTANAAGTITTNTRSDFDSSAAPRVEPGAGPHRIDHLVAQIRRSHHQSLPANEQSPAAIGIAVPGVLSAQGTITQSLVAPDLVGINLASELSDRLQCPVVVENDIKLAAYAEHHMLAPTKDIVFLEIGHRISVALIVGGRILQGSRRLAGELGLQRRMRWTQSSERGQLRWSTGEDAKPLFDRAAAGDQEAIAEIDDFCAQIAPRIAALLLTLDPDALVVGGGVSRAGAVLIEPLERHVHQLLMAPDRPPTLTARLTSDGAVVGALGRAFEHGSDAVVGVRSVPAPWSQLTAPQPLTTPDPDHT